MVHFYLTIYNWYQLNVTTGEWEYLDTQATGTSSEQVWEYVEVPCGSGGQEHDIRYAEVRIIQNVGEPDEIDPDDGPILVKPCQPELGTSEIFHPIVEGLGEEATFPATLEEIESNNTIVDVSSLYDIDFGCPVSEDEMNDFIIEEMEIIGECSQESYENMLNSILTFPTELLCSLFGDPIDWLELSDQERIEKIISNLMFKNFLER